MASIKPVDFDPFAPVATQGASVREVDHDPFAVEPSTGDKVAAVARAGWEGITSPVRLAEQVIGKMGIPGVSDAMRADAEERGQAVEQAQQTAPGWATGANVLGSMLSPPSVAAMGAFPAAAGAAPSVIRSALQGAGQGSVFGAMQPVENPDDMLSEKARQVTWGAGGGALGGALGGQAQKVIAGRAAAKAANATQDAAAVAAREAGYTLPPVTTNPSVTNRVLEGFAGKLTTAQQASMNNQAVTNGLVRKALGMADDAPITKEALGALRKNAGAAYEAVAGVPQPFVADGAFKSAVAAMRDKANQVAGSFPSMSNSGVASLLDDLERGVFDPRAAVEASKQMRAASSKVLGSPMADPAAIQVARSQKEAAKALEDLIARNLKANGMDDLFGAWQSARTEIAKIKTVEKALNETTGNVAAGKLAKEAGKGRMLTNELRTIAQAGQAFPKAVREVTESMPGISPLDYAVGGGLGTISGNPMLLAAPLARPALRHLILSPAYQRAMGSPGYGSPLARLINGSRPALPGAAGSLLLAD